MCSDLTVPTDIGSGTILVLDQACKVEHVMRKASIKLARMLAPKGEKEQDQDFVPSSRAGFHLFSALSEHAGTLVIENYYYDLDTRSEVAELQATRFGAMAPYTSRFHFFGDAAEPEESLRGFVQRAAQSYIGYSVIRHQYNGRIGRSLVPVNSTIYDNAGRWQLSNTIVAQQTRTAVVEHLNLFGIELTATGVAFMEQDGSLLRCAHVSAWICHYSAVLRNAVPRRATGHFHRTGDSHRALGRRYPSIGLSVEEMSSMLRNSDMPPERLDREVLRDARYLNWADTKADHATIDELRKEKNRCQGLKDVVDAENKVLTARAAAGETIPQEEHDDHARKEKKSRKATEAIEAEVDEFWIRRNLVASVCRYLNSAIPLILVRYGISHTQVVVAYLRNMDLPEGERLADAGDSEVVKLIVSDDAEGPFRLVAINDLVTEIDEESTELLVPLPHSLWMPSSVAEKIATKLLAQAAKLRLERLDKWDAIESPDERALYRKSLSQLNIDFDERERTEVYTVHVYATTGVALKKSVASRLATDPEFVRVLATLQLPKYVWVGEVVERAIHGDPSVRGMIVLDASQPWSQDLDGVEALEVLPLFVHIPGHIQWTPFGYGFAGLPRPGESDIEASNEEESGDEISTSTEGGTVAKQSKEMLDKDRERDAYWKRGPFEPYFTGRWGPDRLAEQTAGSQAGQAKIAMVTE